MALLVLLWTVCSATAGLGQAANAASRALGDVRVQYFEGCWRSVQFSLDGRYLLIDNSGNATLYSSRGQLLTTLHAGESEWDDRITSAAFSPDGTHVAVGTSRGKVALWTLPGTFDRESTASEDKEISCLVFRPDGGAFATGSEDNTVRLWRADGMLISYFGVSPGLPYDWQWGPSSLCFSPDGNLLAVSVGDVVRLWDVSGMEAEPVQFSLPGREATFSPDGSLLAVRRVGTMLATAGLWNLDGSKAAALDTDLSLEAIAFCLDGRYVAAASWDGTVLIWDFRGTLLRQIPKPDNPYQEVSAIAWSPDLVTVAVAGGYCP